MKKIFLVALSIIILSCVNQEDKRKIEELTIENKKLSTKIDSLNKEIDFCINGESKIIARIDKNYDAKKLELTKKDILLLENKFPASKELDKYKKMYAEIELAEKKQIEEEKRKKAEEERLANLNNKGIWMIGYFVDDFGEPTNKKYITNIEDFTGFFSNSATQNSKLKATIIVENASDISFMLYEYAGNNPVKGYSRHGKKYTLKGKGANGGKITAYGTNYSDRVVFRGKSARKIHNLLMQGGSIMFVINESNRSINSYKFRISNADYYNNAYRIMTKGK